MLDAQRKKLDDISVKCILLGVSEESKACRLYDLVAERVLIRDVKFVEDDTWDRREEDSSSKSRVVDLEEKEVEKRATDTNA